MPDLVQVLNPKIDRYVLIDRASGEIMEHREEPGPYPGVPVVKMRTIQDPIQTSGRITVKEAQEAAKAVKARRTDAGEFAERYIREHPETFRDLAGK